MYNSPIAVLKGIKTDFAKWLGQMDGPIFKDFVFITDSDTDLENYRYLDTMPWIKEWKDNRVRQNFKDYNYRIINKHWEISINVNRDTLDDSKKTLGGDIEKDVRAAAMAFNNFPDYLVSELLTDNGTSFDESSFFANSHNIDGTNAIDNLYSGTGITLATIEADLAGARNLMHGYRDKNGNPINMAPRFIALIPTHLHDTFLTLRNSQQIYDGSGNKTNIYNESFDIVLNHWQSSSNNDWYLINQNAVLLPFTYQERQKVKFNFDDDPKNIDILYMMDARSNAGYGNFTSIIKVDN